MVDPRLDRRPPTDWRHVERFPLRVERFATAPPTERILNIPRQYREPYDQGDEGACVGFSQSWLMSILNRKRYDARKLYREAQHIDEWADTPPEEGTSLRAGFDVLRTIGHWRVYDNLTRPPELEEGITENRWARSVEEVRTCLATGLPVNLGILWYSSFHTPDSLPRVGDRLDSQRRDYWIGTRSRWGGILGGHAITVVGLSDRREAFALCNTWGMSYPFLVWLPFTAFERLLAEDGEAGIITDRVR